VAAWKLGLPGLAVGSSWETDSFGALGVSARWLRRKLPRPSARAAAALTEGGSLSSRTLHFALRKKNGHADAVLNAAGCSAEKYVGKEAVSVVLIATKSQPFCRIHLMISFTGSP